YLATRSLPPRPPGSVLGRAASARPPTRWSSTTVGVDGDSRRDGTHPQPWKVTHGTPANTVVIHTVGSHHGSVSHGLPPTAGWREQAQRRGSARTQGDGAGGLIKTRSEVASGAATGPGGRSPLPRSTFTKRSLYRRFSISTGSMSSTSGNL